MNRIKLAATVLFFSLVLIGLSYYAVAAQGTISVISSAHQNNFPTKITFALEASSDFDITKATLYYKMKGSPILTYAYAKFDRGKHIQTEYVWNTQRKYLPPGVELRYYWVIEDAAGNKLRSEQSSFVIADTRFSWQEQTGNNVTLYWYEGNALFANTILEFAGQALDRLSREMGIQIEEPVKLFIYANTKDLLGALEPKAQEWTGGRSFSDLGIIVLAVEPNEPGVAWAERAVAHELSHVVISQVTRNPYGDIPHWLDEGLAMHAEGELEPSYRRPLEAAIRSNRLISVRSLGSNFPADPAAALLSYAESYSIVDFILKTYGRDKMAELLAIFKEGSTYDDALMAVFGLDVEGLEAEWRRSLGLEPIANVDPTPRVGQNLSDRSQARP